MFLKVKLFYKLFYHKPMYTPIKLVSFNVTEIYKKSLVKDDILPSILIFSFAPYYFYPSNAGSSDSGKIIKNVSNDKRK